MCYSSPESAPLFHVYSERVMIAISLNDFSIVCDGVEGNYVLKSEVIAWCDDYLSAPIELPISPFDHCRGRSATFFFASEADALLFWKKWLSAYPYPV
jgi:hypothetical protein